MGTCRIFVQQVFARKSNRYDDYTETQTTSAGNELEAVVRKRGFVLCFCVWEIATRFRTQSRRIASHRARVKEVRLNALRTTIAAPGMQHPFFTKAERNLASANMLFDAGHYDDAMNRAYYAVFHAAISILAQHGIRNDSNPHEWVQAQFSAELINRRKVFRSDFANVLPELQRARHDADYKENSVSKANVERHIRKATLFCTTVQEKLQP
jgi:uncharacterized protein (UPF0332 family)